MRFDVVDIIKPTLLQRLRIAVCKHHLSQDCYLHQYYKVTPRLKLIVGNKYYQEYETVMKCERCGDEKIGKYMGTSATEVGCYGPEPDCSYIPAFEKLFDKIMKDYDYDRFGSWWHLDFKIEAADAYDNGKGKRCKEYMKSHLKDVPVREE